MKHRNEHNMKLSVIIVSYNVVHYLEQCLYSVFKAFKGIEAEVWVVDNASTDGTQKTLPEKFPEVHYIFNEDNVGFSKANNQAIERATGDYVLFLNPDTVVGENVFAQCVSFMDQHIEAGAIGVSMLRDDGSFAWESRRGLPTPFTAFCKMSGLGAIFPKSRTFGRYYMRYLNSKEVNEIEVVSGAYMMLRRNALDRVGWLDEDFFMYGEDIDLSYRMLKAGYQNYYLPCNILHYKGESTQKSSFKYVNVFYRAMLTFFDKHFRTSYFLISPLIRVAVFIRGFLDLLLQQRERKKIKGGINKIRKFVPVICFIGRDENIPHLKAIAERNKLRIECYVANEELLEKGHLVLKENLHQYNVIAYDNSLYSNEKILALMQESSKMHNLKLALYSPETNKMITLNNVYM